MQISNFYLAKSKASGFHFLTSFFVVSIFIAILLYFWYPEPYFTATGGWQGLKLVVLIDLVLGPFLTFIVFNKAKPFKELRNDLLFIISLQMLALIWGVHTVYNQRPIAIVFWEKAFYSVPYQAVSKHYNGTTKLNSLTKKPRELFIVNKPESVKGLLELDKEVQQKQLPPYQLIDRYQNYEDDFNMLKKFSVNIIEIIQKNAGMKASLFTLLNSNSSKIEDNIYLRLISKYQNIIIVFTKDGKQLGFIKAPLKTNY